MEPGGQFLVCPVLMVSTDTRSDYEEVNGICNDVCIYYM